MKCLFTPFWTSFFVFVPAVFSQTAFGADSDKSAMNHYEVLRVPESASIEEITLAHKIRRGKVHPDRNSKPGAEEEFEAVQAAFAVLSNPNERKIYDNWLRSERASQPPASYRSPPPPASLKSINNSIRVASREAKGTLDRELHRQYRYSQGFRDEQYWKRRGEIGAALRNRFEEITPESGLPQNLKIPRSALHFPQAASFLAEKGADLRFALIEALLMREPATFGALIRHDMTLINTTNEKETPLFNLVLEKISSSQEEAVRHYNQPSCPPSCYGSWKKTAEGWDDLANEILSGGKVDLTLRDAKGKFALLKALEEDLKIYQRIFRIAGDSYLTDEDKTRLIEAASDNQNRQAISFFRSRSPVEDSSLTALGEFRQRAAKQLGGSDQAIPLPGKATIHLPGPKDGEKNCRPGLFKRLLGKKN